MSFFEKDINHLEESDLQSLIVSGFAEASIIEYKTRLNFQTNDEIGKVLSQVSSFANARGGHLVYGMAAENGVPTKLEGQIESDADGLVLRIESVIRTSIHPRLSSFELRPMPLANGNHAFVFKVDQSWNRPHQFRHNNKYLFYTRSSNGIAQIDVEDLRNLFVGAHDVKQRIEAFRQERIGDLLSGTTPVGAVALPIAALHFVPLSNFSKGELQKPIVFSHHRDNLVPKRRFGYKSFHNFDGHVFADHGEHGANFYIQGFRDFRIEAVLGEYSWSRGNESPSLPQTELASELVLMVDKALGFYRTVNVLPPILVMFTLLGVKGLKFQRTQRMFTISQTPFDRDVLQFPAIFVDSYDMDAPRLLKPTLDMLWQSVGNARCFDYDGEGNWLEDR